MNDIVTYVHERVQNMTSEEREAKAIPFKRLRKEIFVKYFKLDPNKSSKRAKKKYEKKPTVCRTIKEALEQELLKLFPKRKKKSAGVKSVVKPKEVYKSTAPENVTILSRCGVSERSGSFMGRVATIGEKYSLYEVTFFYEEEALIFVDKMKHKHNIPFVARGQSNRAKPQNVKGSLSMDWPLDVHRNSSELATAHKNGSKEQRRILKILREKKKRLANSAATTASSSAIVNLATSSDDEDDDEDDGNDDPPPKSTKRSRNTSSTSSSTSSKLPPHKQMKLQ